MGRIKTNKERRAKKDKKKQKEKLVKDQSFFTALKKVVELQEKLDNMARDAGMTEEEIKELNDEIDRRPENQYHSN